MECYALLVPIPIIPVADYEESFTTGVVMKHRRPLFKASTSGQFREEWIQFGIRGTLGWIGFEIELTSKVRIYLDNFQNS